MNKLKKLCVILITLLLLSGCFKRDDLEDIDVYTTVYPITYITEKLYGYNSNVKSIYPAGVDLSKYSLTNKQKESYAEGGLFVYNGLGDETLIARDLINRNNNMKIIDVSEGMEYERGICELWLNPSDFLMLANNLKTGLENYIKSTVVKQEINKNYNDLKLLISSYDAEMEMMSINAEDKNIIIASEELLFLSEYGLTVTDVDSTYYEVSSKSMEEARRLIASGKVKYIYMLDTTKETAATEELKNLGAEIIKIHSMTVLSESEENEHTTYETMMRDNIDNFKKELIE